MGEKVLTSCTKISSFNHLGHLIYIGPIHLVLNFASCLVVQVFLRDIFEGWAWCQTKIDELAQCSMYVCMWSEVSPEIPTLIFLWFYLVLSLFGGTISHHTSEKLTFRQKLSNEHLHNFSNAVFIFPKKIRFDFLENFQCLL